MRESEPVNVFLYTDLQLCFYEWYSLGYYIYHIVLFELHHSSLGSCD